MIPTKRLTNWWNFNWAQRLKLLRKKNRKDLIYMIVCCFDVNCRLDMCRRQYANDACNRGTAGNFGTDPSIRSRWASHNPFLIFRSLFMFICFMCSMFYSSVNKINFHPTTSQPPFKIYTKNIYLHTFFMRLNCFEKLNYCFLSPFVFHIAIRLCELPSEHTKKRQWFIAVFHSIRFLFTPLSAVI